MINKDRVAVLRISRADALDFDITRTNGAGWRGVTRTTFGTTFARDTPSCFRGQAWVGTIVEPVLSPTQTDIFVTVVLRDRGMVDEASITILTVSGTDSDDLNIAGTDLRLLVVSPLVIATLVITSLIVARAAFGAAFTSDSPSRLSTEVGIRAVVKPVLSALETDTLVTIVLSDRRVVNET